MKDDPREVDWAPKKIEELNDRLHRLERQTQFETSEDNDRIKALEAAVRELQSAVASMRTQQDFMIGEGHGEPFEVWCRRKINGLAHGFEVHTRLIEQSQERVDGMTPYVELESRVSALEGHPRRDPYDSMKGGVSDADEFMKAETSFPPGVAVAGMEHYMVSPVVETAEQIEERRRVLVESMKDRRITFDPEPVNTEAGPPAGWVQAQDGSWLPPFRLVLDEAAARVRRYMGNLDLDPEFTTGVVRAIQGEFEPDGVEHPPIPGPKSTFLDRRDVNEREAAKIVATKCPGFGQCYASDRLHWHDQYGVVHIN